jgi:hypothetical protein
MVNRICHAHCLVSTGTSSKITAVPVMILLATSVAFACETTAFNAAELPRSTRGYEARSRHGRLVAKPSGNPWKPCCWTTSGN